MIHKGFKIKPIAAITLLDASTRDVQSVESTHVESMAFLWTLVLESTTYTAMDKNLTI